MLKAEEILRLSKQYENYTANNLSQIVKMKSLSGGEKVIAYAIKEMMKEAGFEEARIDGLGNVIGRIGSGDKVIAIDGHIDTVDLGNLENWDFDPLGGEIKDGFVHGRGTVDQEGGPIAAVTAGRILNEIGIPEDVTLLVTATVMEEDCDGLCWKYILLRKKKLNQTALLLLNQRI